MEAPHGDKKVPIYQYSTEASRHQDVVTAGSICLHIDCRIHKVYILPIQLLTQEFHGLAEPLEMDDLPLPEETDDVVDVRVVADAQDVVISHPRLLLWYAQSFATIFILKFWNKRLISAILSLKYSYIFGFLLNWPV